MSQKRSMSKVEEVALCEQVTKIVMQERKRSKIFSKTCSKSGESTIKNGIKSFDQKVIKKGSERKITTHP